MNIKASEITLVDVDSIVPHPKNNNRHSVEQIKRLEKLIKHNGFRVPLIISKRSGFLIAGHGRLDAAKNIQMKHVPVIYQEFESEAEEYQFLTADNAIQAWSELDMQSVHDFLGDFPDFDIDLLALKFDFSQLEEVEEVEKEQEKEEKFVLEVKFKNDMDMMDIHDDLVSKGYMVKVRK